jgi:hypothetical protein
MSRSAPVASQSDEQRWIEWQSRGLDGDRRRAAAMKWIMAVIAIVLGAWFGILL